MHHGVRRKHVPFSSGNRGLWQKGKWALQTLPGAERHQEPPQSSESSCKGKHHLQESPSEETSAWNFSSRAGMTAREHGIAWHYYKGSMNTEPSAVCPTKLVMAMSGRHWAHLGLCFDLFHREWEQFRVPQPWPQHYTMVRVSSTPQDNCTHLLALVHNHTTFSNHSPTIYPVWFPVPSPTFSFLVLHYSAF